MTDLWSDNVNVCKYSVEKEIGYLWIASNWKYFFISLFLQFLSVWHKKAMEITMDNFKYNNAMIQFFKLWLTPSKEQLKNKPRLSIIWTSTTSDWYSDKIATVFDM